MLQVAIVESNILQGQYLHFGFLDRCAAMHPNDTHVSLREIGPFDSNHLSKPADGLWRSAPVEGQPALHFCFRLGPKLGREPRDACGRPGLGGGAFPEFGSAQRVLQLVWRSRPTTVHACSLQSANSFIFEYRAETRPLTAQPKRQKSGAK